MKKNQLFYGDNLDVMRRYINDESVDLVYLDPPFNSNVDYNILFQEQTGEKAAAQIKAFEDTWEWNIEAARSYEEVVEEGGLLSEAMQGFRKMLGASNMMAYLAMMAPRLLELNRVLKPLGSLYLHCDPTASHYLKVVLDAIFHPRHFQNEIIWKRTSAHVNPKRWGPVHDVLLFYSKSQEFTWNTTFQEYETGYLSVKYRNEDERGRYRLTDLTGAGWTAGDSGRPWKGFTVQQLGRHWAVPRDEVVALVGAVRADEMTTQEKLDLLDKNGYIYWTPKSKRRDGGVGFPQFKRYLTGGVPIQDVITDIPPINSQAQERLGYPTQKPEALLDRIIAASSNVGDLVLDPFCGCGTTIAAAERLGRQWIGIDITHLAVGLIKHRLRDQFGEAITESYDVIGEPVSVPDAEILAREDPFQFQAWALGLVGARTAQSSRRGSDQGVDGNLYFHDEPKGRTKRVVLSVKAGQNVSVAMVRDLVGTLAREKADIGVLITMSAPTGPMVAEAASAGFYTSPMGGKHQKVQILTIAQLLNGAGIDYPTRAQRADRTFKRAPKAAGPKVAALHLGLDKDP